MTDYTWLLVALPLAGAAILLFGGRRTDAWGHWLGCLAALSAFGVGATLLADLLGRAADDRVIHQKVFTWIPAGGLQVDFGLQIDQLSMCFVLLISGVGSLIHIYSVAYMAEDEDRRRFFGYLNLFLASMLLLVIADNYVLLYVGWEGVGLASYLLIGFWYHKPSAATAAKKAFVMNRVGDAGLALAMFLMFATFGTVSYSGVFAGVPAASEAVLNVTGLLLLLGACAKSAQVPLQAWLGDAMEGPTPVSALIHAATMVTAGVYLIVRSNPLFNLAPGAQLGVVIVGAVTLMLGAFIGCAKDDIKRALAASTMSQIGYMVLAAGLGPAGYAFAIMHLLTHGFFKAGLFLGSGAVIHAMHEEQDMRRYGGLRAALPITFVTFGLGYLAIIGVPPFAGFFSKDAIIEAALGAGGVRGYVLGGTALLGAGITAFYMTRVMLMTFFGKKRWAPQSHPHEAPALMTWPMILLAVGSVFSGGLFAIGGTLAHWLEPVVGAHEESAHAVPAWVSTTLALSVVVVGVAVAYRMYGGKAEIPRVAPVRVSPLTTAARADAYGDAFNEEVFMRPGAQLTKALVAIDDAGVDGSVNSLAALISRTSNGLRQLQTGFARNYALSMLVGAAAVAAVLLAVNLW
ncbi:NADH-quinone oxidoreductase subunit L [Mycobacterium intermedium]|uniref:NADH-quinone oxidoreductase subunit L n=1 Tax=Mycobacterium intermedium TaxID=28445 RepID=A0A1E3SFP7_MYCIE|nr:NADH-quinone oxidoreductase subunit L [Mycobacterium intermedium]MCV6966159.1 NADH-quinone oxidoreductase subunit L [Mycobacterium intermedium]ODR00951.1 NADH-quinone oxidoreductase subunit L [Mycobacterium intermedium]OPE47916.1 NADH-quinone oxidoreductase subunit L [Mycobacterium intermedium]ORB09842.1 NADH-quinone oxidoreductase subunit L [Mycobacterium intermedium]